MSEIIYSRIEQFPFLPLFLGGALLLGYSLSMHPYEEAASFHGAVAELSVDETEAYAALRWRAYWRVNSLK